MSGPCGCGGLRFVVSHLSDKNKYVARVRAPGVWLVGDSVRDGARGDVAFGGGDDFSREVGA